MTIAKFLVLHNDKGEPIAIASVDKTQTPGDAYVAAKLDLFDQWLEAAKWVVRETQKGMK